MSSTPLYQRKGWRRFALVVRLLLSAALLYVVYGETGWATTFVLASVTLCLECQTVINDTQTSINNHANATARSLMELIRDARIRPS